MKIPFSSTQSQPARLTRLARTAPVILVGLVGLLGLVITANPAAGESALALRADDGKDARKFVYEIRDRRVQPPGRKPQADDFAFSVTSEGDAGNSSGRITLDPRRWKKIRDDDGDIVGYRYIDRSGSYDGVTRVVWRPGRITIKAKGARWKWRPTGDEASVFVTLEQSGNPTCSEFDFDDPAPMRFVATSNAGLESCPPQLCGNGVVEPGEQCDDGDRNNDNGCTRECRRSVCGEPDFDSTFDAIQAVVFEDRSLNCTNGVCHGVAQEGDLSLLAGDSFDDLVDVVGPLEQVRVVPGDRDASFLYTKLATKTLGDPEDVPGAGMPIGGNVLGLDALEAIGLWIDAGAPDEESVLGTGDLLGVCLDEPEEDVPENPSDTPPLS